MTTPCPECHHTPSCRFDAAGMQCYCECHDQADAGPYLLSFCRTVDELCHELHIAIDELANSPPFVFACRPALVDISNRVARMQYSAKVALAAPAVLANRAT